MSLPRNLEAQQVYLGVVDAIQGHLMNDPDLVERAVRDAITQQAPCSLCSSKDAEIEKLRGLLTEARPILNSSCFTGRLDLLSRIDAALKETQP